MEIQKNIDEKLLLKCLKAFAKGDLSVAMPENTPGMAGEIGRAFNNAVRYAARLADTGETGKKTSIAAFTGKRILIVDDDVRSLFAVRSLLENHGAQVLIAENGEQCLKTIQQTEVDLILLDIMMPGMQGYEVMQLIRQRQRFASLPIIALTAKALEGDREKCLRAGATEYLSKPTDHEQLLLVLRKELLDDFL